MYCIRSWIPVPNPSTKEAVPDKGPAQVSFTMFRLLLASNVFSSPIFTTKHDLRMFSIC